VSFLRNLSYSVSGGVIISAIGTFWNYSICEVVAIPGIVLEGWTNLLIIELSKGSYRSMSGTWPIFNFVVYSSLIFITLSSCNLLNPVLSSSVKGAKLER